MEASFLTQWFSDHDIKAICWTLIHSLWVGMVIALLAALVITLTRKSAADLRYRLLCGILMLFVLAMFVIFYIQLYSTGAGPSNLNNVKLIISQVNIGTIDNHVAAAHISPVNKAVNFLNAYTNIIFGIWLLFFMMKSLKMLGGLLYIHRIRTYKVHAVAEKFIQKVELFGRQIGIRQAIRLVQSELVKVPVAVGWLKPVILLPVGIIFQLSTEQLEGILWHELAHIHRRDYLVNILQGLVESVFFFNPGFLWLSSLIRAEREACCDDIVLSRVGHKANYLEALLSFGHGEYQHAGLAMGLGSGSQLRDRLKRMISQENKKLNAAEKVVLVMGMIMLSAFTFIPKANSELKHSITSLKKNIRTIINSPKAKALPEVLPAWREKAPVNTPVKHSRYKNADKPAIKKDSLVERDTIRFTNISINSENGDTANREIDAVDDKGNRYHFKVVNNQLAALGINGTTIADNELNKYQDLLHQLDQQLYEKRRMKYKNIALFKAAREQNKIKELAFKDKMKPIKFKNVQKRRNDTVPPKAGKYKFSYMEMAALKRLAIQGDTNPTHDQVQREIFAAKGEQVKKRDSAWKEKTLVKMKKRDSVFFKKIGQKKIYDSLYFARQDEQQRIVKEEMKGIISDLINENIVKDKSSLSWFGLTYTELIVNGIKQPDDIQRKLKEKYIKNPRFGFFYGPVQMYGMGYFYGKNDL